MAKMCAICGKEVGGFSSCALIDSETVGLPDELRQELSTEVMCLPCHSILVKVRQSDPQAQQSWQQYMNNQQRDSIRRYMKESLEEPQRAAVRAQQRAAEQRQRSEARSPAGIWVTSGFNFEGYAIVSYRGFLSEETVVSMGFLNGSVPSARTLTSTDSDTLMQKLRESKQIVMQRLSTNALGAGANAIIGLDLDYTMLGDSIIGVIASGTAVTVVPNRPVQQYA